MKTFVLAVACLVSILPLLAQPPETGQAPSPTKRGPRRPKPGVSTPGVKRDITTIKPVAVFTTGGTPDWQVLTEDSLWVANGPMNSVHRLDPKTNQIAATITVGK